MCQIWLPCYKNGISVFFFPVFSCRCQLLFFDLAEDLIGRNDTVFNYGVKEQTLNETEDIKVLYTLFTITHTHTHTTSMHAQYETTQHRPFLSCQLANVYFQKFVYPSKRRTVTHLYVRLCTNVRTPWEDWRKVVIAEFVWMTVNMKHLRITLRNAVKSRLRSRTLVREQREIYQAAHS